MLLCMDITDTTTCSDNSEAPDATRQAVRRSQGNRMWSQSSHDSQLSDNYDNDDDDVGLGTGLRPEWGPTEPRRISRLSSFFPSSNRLLSAASIQRSATRQHRPMIPPPNPISRISARLTMLLWSPQTRPTASFPSP